jgi:glycosyltransferase involved in cell wall biosynthesis
MNVNRPATVSVIICCYTEERLQDIREAVASVQAQTRQPEEIILAVDNNRALYERLGEEFAGQVTVVLNDTIRGLSATRNVGVATAQGDLIAFLDDDAVAEPEWLANLVEPFQNCKVMSVGGQAVAWWPTNNPPTWFPDEFDFIIGCTAHKKLVMGEGGSIRNVTGSNMCFRKEVFEKVGLWHTGLGRGSGNPTGGEEANICLRITQGIPNSLVLYEPKASVLHKVHPKRATPKYFLSFCFREGFTRARLEKETARFVENPLDRERLFIRQVAFRSLPQRLKHFYRWSSIAQLGVIASNLMLLGIGYMLGKLKYR